jgi:glycosyltransferase involved in cell wall biosynthesis
MERQLSIITIAFEETEDLIETYNSIKFMLELGSKWILVINQNLKNFVPTESTTVIESKDEGLYDALNLGLNEVDTDYFMLLHSGDIIFDSKAFTRALTYAQDGYDLVLGGSEIGNRLHKSRYWKKWMLRFYVQPPHLPIIYRTQSCIKERYSLEIPTVADFYYLRKLFQKEGIHYKHSGEVYIRMSPGGLTTSGLSSFLHVTASFMKVDGFMPLLISPFRLLLKILIR